MKGPGVFQLLEKESSQRVRPTILCPDLPFSGDTPLPQDKSRGSWVVPWLPPLPLSTLEWWSWPRMAALALRTRVPHSRHQQQSIWDGWKSREENGGCHVTAERARGWAHMRFPGVPKIRTRDFEVDWRASNSTYKANSACILKLLCLME